jgi:two-component flavin-dependent monooxygenase
VCGRMAAYLPAAAQRDIWGKDPNRLIAASFRPTGTAVSTANGWQLSGRWHYLSGIEHADWALLSFAPYADSPHLRYGLVATRAGSIIRDWDTLGMRGTGSHTIELEAVEVPLDRTFANEDLWAGRSRHAAGPSYEVAPLATDAPLFAAVALGSTRALLDIAVGESRRAMASDGDLAASFSRSLGEIDAAALLIDRACQLCDRGSMTDAMMWRNARDASIAVSLLTGSVSRIYPLLGSHAYSSASSSMRRWRDIQTLVSHVALRANKNMTGFAKANLLESADSP